MISFICEPCKDQHHEGCPGKAQCDCMHRVIHPEPATGPVGE